ncbi:MAG TPA: S-adenosylmethionine:tRNA ribosyltransferase-isomerase [Cryptosporangiaceae bacterium]|nr:S-adenosylmethionine:tRNA ribosyltransferase-isomerase [Cryptosporangiaceae bacterium]
MTAAVCAEPVPALPAETVATGPPEARGFERDGVRMLVATPEGLSHRVVRDLPAVLRAGDVLVLNTSDTLPAALRGVTADGERVEVHLSTLDPSAGDGYREALRATDTRWVVEVRIQGGFGGQPSYADRAGAEVGLAGGGVLRVVAGYPDGTAAPRLWRAELRTPTPLLDWLHAHGAPIRYSYVSAPWPHSAYRTTHADTPGSAEMPSAGRPLSPVVLRRLRARGVEVAPLVLHCGVSSLEAGDPPCPEWFEVPPSTAATVTAARQDGRRVIAAGTTVVRALESAVGPGGDAEARHGWTDLVVTPERGVSTLDGLLTGWHEPAASHLQLLRAVGGCRLLQASYQEAARAGYRWHEFGDLHLILPADPTGLRRPAVR